MISQYRTIYRTVGVVILMIALRQSGNAQSTAPEKTASTDTKPAEQVYKNIQVLKGIPSDQLIPSMRCITASLGVECGFCHVERHFDKDDKKPKQIARKMIQMVTAINQNNFDSHQVVTCDSCHRGSRWPVSIPPTQPVREEMQKTDQQLPSNLPNAEDLIKKYIEASGGATALEKITTRSETGTAEFFGHQIQVEILDKTPDKLLSIMHLPNGDGVTGINGDQGWEIYPHRPVLAMSQSEVEVAKMGADLQLALHLERLFPELKSAAPEAIDGRDAFQLVALTAGQPRAKFYFDEQSGLLVRALLYAATPLGLNPVQIDYADYRPVDGVLVPFRWTTSRPEGQFTIQLSDVKQNVAIEDSRFAEPTSPASAEKQP